MSNPAKFRYLIVQEDYTIKGFSNEEEAIEASEWSVVIDCETGETLEWNDAEDKCERIPIKEYSAINEEDPPA